MGAAWASALGVAKGEVPFRLGEVGLLFREVRDAASEVGRAYAGIPDHLKVLSAVIFPDASGLGNEAVRPHRPALEALGMFSAYLEDVRPDGRMPDDDELNTLRGQVQQLLSDIAAADLPPDVQRALQHRLAEVLEALNNLLVTGPDAAARAAEALLLVATAAEESGVDAPLMRRVKKLGRATVKAVTVAGSLVSLTVGLDKIIDGKLLGPGQGEVRRLGPGPSVESDRDDAPDADDAPNEPAAPPHKP